MQYFRLKLLHLVPVFFLVTFASFMVLNLLPGDLVDAILLDEESAPPTEEDRQALAKELNLDKPVIVRYAIWLGNMLTGDLGRSYVTAQPVTEALGQRIPISLELMLMAQILAVLISVPLGIISGYRANSAFDRSVSAGAFGMLAIPVFIAGTMLIWIFAIILGWLPSSGHTAMSEGVWRNLEKFILPAFTIALVEVPVLMRVLRTDIITTLQEDFIALAKSKGMTTSYILFHHALRPSSFSYVTLLGLQLGNLITGSIVVETLFSIPGVGQLLINSVDNRDEIMVQGVITFVALVYVGVNLAVDLMYAVLDPRVARRS
jgi:peptide/nickel transport system permease protein